MGGCEYSSGSSRGFGVRLNWVIHNQSGHTVCHHGGKHQQIRQRLWAELREGPGKARSLLSLLEAADPASVTAAYCCSQESAPIGNYPLCLSQSQSCTYQSSKGSECQTQKQFHNASAPISWGLCLLRSLNVFLSKHETSSSQPVTLKMNYDAWSYSLMRQIIQSCPSFQYFTFHCVYLAHHLSSVFSRWRVIQAKPPADPLCLGHPPFPWKSAVASVSDTVLQKNGKSWFSDSNWDNNRSPIFFMSFNKNFSKCSILVYL